jgi:hypothetical protein
MSALDASGIAHASPAALDAYVAICEKEGVV